MRSLTAIALGLLIIGIGLYAAPAVTPLAFPAAFDSGGRTVHPVALFVMLSITEVFAMFGGWVTARLVDDHQTGHALLVGICGLAVAIAAGAIRWSTAPSWYHVTSWLLLPCAAAIGAAAWQRTVRRQDAVTKRRIAAT